MATYVAKEDIHVIREDTSLCSGDLGGPRLGGREASRSAMATLSGRSSLILMNSNAWMQRTSLAGIGARLVANLKGDGLGALGGLESREVPMVLHDTLVSGSGPGE